MATIRIRDVQKYHHQQDLPSDTRVLLVPNDLWNSEGPCVPDGEGLVVYRQRGTGEHTARVRQDTLAHGHPGDRVLIQYDPEHVRDGEWWLCEVVAVNGDDAG